MHLPSLHSCCSLCFPPQDCLAFVRREFPEYLEPYQRLGRGVERADFFRCVCMQTGRLQLWVAAIRVATLLPVCRLPALARHCCPALLCCPHTMLLSHTCICPEGTWLYCGTAACMLTWTASAGARWTPCCTAGTHLWRDGTMNSQMHRQPWMQGECCRLLVACCNMQHAAWPVLPAVCSMLERRKVPCCWRCGGSCRCSCFFCSWFSLPALSSACLQVCAHAAAAAVGVCGRPRPPRAAGAV